MTKKFIVPVMIVAFLAIFLSGCFAYTKTSEDDILSLINMADKRLENFNTLHEISLYHGILTRAHLYEVEKGIAPPVSDAGDSLVYVNESSVTAAAKLIYGNTVKIKDDSHYSGAKYIKDKKAYAYGPINDGSIRYIVKSSQSGNTITVSVVLLRYIISNDKVILDNIDEDGNRLENLPNNNGELLTTEQVKEFSDKLPQHEYTIKKRANGTLWIKSCRTRSSGLADFPDINEINKARKAAYNYIYEKYTRSIIIDWKNAQVKLHEPFNNSNNISIAYIDVKNKKSYPVNMDGMDVYEVKFITTRSLHNTMTIFVDKNTMKVLGSVMLK